MDEGLTQFCTILWLWDEYRIDFYSNTVGSAKATGIFEAYNQLCVSTQDNTSLYNAYTQSDFNNGFYQYVVKSVVPLYPFYRDGWRRQVPVRLPGIFQEVGGKTSRLPSICSTP